MFHKKGRVQIGRSDTEKPYLYKYITKLYLSTDQKIN